MVYQLPLVDSVFAISLWFKMVTVAILDANNGLQLYQGHSIYDIQRDYRVQKFNETYLESWGEMQMNDYDKVADLYLITYMWQTEIRGFEYQSVYTLATALNFMKST